MHTLCSLGAFALGSALWGAMSSLIGLSAALCLSAACMLASIALARPYPLRMGADDYMVGPLTRNALLDRVLGANLGEQDSAGIRVVTQGEMMVDVAAFQARFQGKPISLMPNELRLLRYFIEHPGRVFSRTQLISALGKQEPPVDERTVDVWIGRLRRALKGVGAGNPLRTVRSLGYVFDTV